MNKEELTPLAFKKRKRARFRKVFYPDGSCRAVRCQSRAQGDRSQAYADFFGLAPALPSGRNMRSIESLVSEIGATLNLEEQGIEPELLNDAWQALMGDYLAMQSQLISIAKDCATIRCLHPAVRFELEKRKGSIIRALNSRFGEASVRRVRFQLG